MIVLDASAGVDLLLRIGVQADLIAERILGPGETLHVPHLFDAEVFSAVRNRAIRKVLTPSRAGQALEDLADLRLTRYPILPFVGRMWALRNDISAFDAVYVALAEALAAPLITTDSKLARTKHHRASVELFP